MLTFLFAIIAVVPAATVIWTVLHAMTEPGEPLEWERNPGDW